MFDRSIRPTTAEPHVGIEIECVLHRVGLEGFVAHLKANYPRLAKYVQVSSDGSISCGFCDIFERATECEVEVKVCAPEKLVTRVVESVCRALKQCGAVTNDTCGLHVHLDARNRDPKQLATKLFLAQDLLFRVAGRGRRSSDYCKPVTSEAEFESFGRYKAINYNAFRHHQTIEVRLARATVNADKIINYTKLLIAIANSNIDKRVRRVEDVAVDPKLLEYYGT